jgi:hypothetical protein
MGSPPARGGEAQASVTNRGGDRPHTRRGHYGSADAGIRHECGARHGTLCILPCMPAGAEARRPDMRVVTCRKTKGRRSTGWRRRNTRRENSHRSATNLWLLTIVIAAMGHNPNILYRAGSDPHQDAFA